MLLKYDIYFVNPIKELQVLFPNFEIRFQTSQYVK